MRNSIQGPLLRTGNNSDFKALGETGYPVFRMAFQLREAIYRQDAGRDLARHLAIPQNEQGGDRTDWYSSFAGDVIPWNSASEQERASARRQFGEFQTAVQALSEQMLNAENSSAGGDRRVFALLLKSVVCFPDNAFLYLVDGVLVITFWGFVHAKGEQREPMHWLLPDPVPVQAAAATGALTRPPLTNLAHSAATGTAHPERVIDTHRKQGKSRWRWLLWLLPALLILALTLGLLRGCVPSLSLSGLPRLSQPVSPTDNGTPVAQQIPDNADQNVSPVTSVAGVPATSGVTSDAVKRRLSGTAQTPVLSQADSAAIATVPEGHSDPITQSHGADDSLSVAEPQTDAEPLTGTATEVPPSVTPAEGKPLTIPPQLTDGPARFLNGQWRVNGGIQDKLTGRPLQLQYDFRQGNGTVSVRQSNGVICQGPAQGRIIQGALSITNPEQMKCSDHSDFMGPAIECQSPAAGHTDCVGNNAGDKTFPIRMMQPHS